MFMRPRPFADPFIGADTPYCRRVHPGPCGDGTLRWYRLEDGGRMVLVGPSAATVAHTLADTEAAIPTVVADRYS